MMLTLMLSGSIGLVLGGIKLEFLWVGLFCLNARNISQSFLIRMNTVSGRGRGLQSLDLLVLGGQC